MEYNNFKIKKTKQPVWEADMEGVHYAYTRGNILLFNNRKVYFKILPSRL